MADALTKTTTIQFPFQPTGKRTKKKPVKEAVPVKTKKRGRPPKDGNSSKRALDLKACNKEHSEAALSKSSRKDEKKIAQSVTSSFPYFVKIIKKFSVGGSCILNVPCGFQWHIFQKEIYKLFFII
ncbi:uncharacterized protein [Medicago truncatula]|uniref:uncharacterized protein n=1 Tax=Medicago truncatula TaxID=3880 RepID=UPI00196749A9|nr:uncharacterized protein LOC120580021 [Medicago truncatula]